MESAANPNDELAAKSTLEVTRWVDARGKLCPEPLLMGRRAIDQVESGQIVAVRSTDPHSELDFEVFVLRTGHELAEMRQTGDEWVFWLRKAEPLTR